MDCAKHRPPDLSGGLERERLLAKLASWDDRKVIVIHGPAGAGKSTLAADYARATGQPVLWYTLDAGDRDPAVFLACFGRAIQRCFPRAVSALSAVPRDRYRGSEPTPVTARWLERLFLNVPSCLLVFDDSHAVHDAAALREILAMIIRSTPPAVRLLLLSRTRPEFVFDYPLPKRSIGELTGEHLRFTDSETVEFFAAGFGYPLSTARASRLCRMMEGWAVGLALVREYLSVAGRMPADLNQNRLLPEFRDRIFGYLASEVFAQLDPPMRRFLLRTSVAEHLPLPLAAEVTALPVVAPPGRPSVTTMLEELGRRNLFLDRSGRENGVRYHALFREFLVREFAAVSKPSTVRDLHRTAAQFYLRNGNAVRAVDLLLASEQFVLAGRLLEKTCKELIGQSPSAALLRLIDSLPEALRERPWFLYRRAVALRFSDPRTALALHDRALAGFRAANDAAGQMLALGGAIEASFHSGRNFRCMERALAQAGRLLRRRRREASATRAALLQAVGMASFFTGRLRQGIETLRAALELFHSVGDHFSVITCSIYLTPCALYHGDFALAREAVQRGFEARRASSDEPGGEAALLLVQAMIRLFQGDFTGAKESLASCRKLTEEYRIESIGLLMLAFSGWLKIAEGDHRGAESLLEECFRRGKATDMTFFSLSAAHFLSLSHLFRGNREQAKRYADHALSSRGRAESPLFRAIYRIVRGTIHDERGDPLRARRDLLTALRVLRQCRAVQQEANAHLALARLHLRRRAPETAVAHLERGFSIGRDLGLTYYALLAPAEVDRLARLAIERNICAEYCSGLLDREHGPRRPVVSIRCLNGFQAGRNGMPIREQTWRGTHTKRLIKLLVASIGKPLSRERVCEILRGTGGKPRSSGALATLLHRARKTLDGGTAGGKGSCIRFENDHLSIDRSSVWTDVEAFRAAIESAMRAEERHSVAEALAQYDEAFALYQGEFLPEDVYEAWTAPVRDGLRNAYLKGLERAADLADSLEDAERAASLYERLFSEDQCNEIACRWIMTRAIAAGRRSEAIRVYERCELALRCELDIEPEEKTRKLYRSIIEG